MHTSELRNLSLERPVTLTPAHDMTVAPSFDLLRAAVEACNTIRERYAGSA